MPEAVIVDAVRTPIGKRKGSLAGVHPVDLSAAVLRALADRTGAAPQLVDDVLWGCVNQVGDQAAQIGRYAVLAAGWPESVAGVTINRACGSSQSALDFNQGIGAERIAARWGFTRRRLDEYAARSHELAAAATDAGAFSGQLTPVPGAPGLTTDEGLRRGTTADTLAALTPSFREDGVIHAGNASQISDGASAVLIATPERAAELGLTPIARYHCGAVSGADPLMMLTGPIPATVKVLGRCGLAVSDIGAFEVNEAFAPVPLAWLAETGADLDRVNPLGGAIAVGHPLGASGTVLMTRLVHHMREHDIRYGLQTMCEGGGTANATIVELLR